MALQGDLFEFNRCGIQLRELYEEGNPGEQHEFLAYRILYFLHVWSMTDLNNIISALSDTDRVHPAVAHALAVRSAMVIGDSNRFFALYVDAPNMSSYVMDHFAGSERLRAMRRICKRYPKQCAFGGWFFSSPLFTSQLPSEYLG